MANRKLQLFLLLLISLITFVVNNGVLEANIMEARNLSAAREILQKKNWLEPTMNGELRLEKPPLPTWIAAVTMHFCGENNLALLRLPSALAALLMILFLFKLTESLTDDPLLPFLCASTAATSFYIFFMARDISWDIFCHSFMVGAIWLIHRELRSKPNGWIAVTLAGVLMGLSFLSKGPVSFYALLLPYLIARSVTLGWGEVKGKMGILLVMFAVTFSVSLWWPIIIALAHPGMTARILYHESSAWFTKDIRPFYHYWSFPVQSGIWTVYAAIALFYPYARRRIDRFGNYPFLFVWVVSAVILLSLFPEKKERYLLPVLIPMALLTASWFRYLIEAFREGTFDKTDLILFRFTTLLMTVVCLGIPVSLIFLPFPDGRPGTGLLIVIFILFWSLALMLGYALLRKEPLRVWMGLVGMVAAVCISLVPVIHKLAITNLNYHSYTELRNRSDLKDIPFFFNGEIPGKFIEVVWNSGHQIKGWNPAVHPQLPVNGPLLLLSNEPPGKVLPEEVLKNYRIEVIGHFDTNMGKHEEKKVLSNYATLIR